MTKLYHLEITPKVSVPPERRREWEYNLCIKELEHRFLAPYRKGKSIVIRGRTLSSMHDLHRIRVYETKHEIGHLTSIPTGALVDVTKEFITDPAGWELEKESEDEGECRPPADTRKVFVVHGRNKDARNALFDFLRAIDLHPLEWSEHVSATGKGSPYIGEILKAAFLQAHAVVVLLTPDDEARLRDQFQAEEDPPHETQFTGQARPNVLFEAGMTMARSQNRTILVELGNLRPFSDIGGRHTIRLDNSSQRRQDLAERLRNAGCPVKLTGTDWHTAGDFEAAIALSTQDLSEPIAADESPSTNSEHLQLSEDAKELLNEAVKSSTRAIMKANTVGGLIIQANGNNLCERGNPRSEAIWEGALKDLNIMGLVEDQKGKGEVFVVTREGFQVANDIGDAEQNV